MAELNDSVKGIWGQQYRLNTLLGKGGEGSVYETDIPGKVAKIYDASKPTIQNRLPELEKKLTYMVMKIPMNFISKATGNVLVPWPQDVLYENGKFVGFLMPKITGAKPIKMIQHGNPYASRAIPGYNWKMALQVAENMAKVVKVLHQYNIVVGDMNSGNIMVYPNGDVVFVDTDSFDIHTDTGEHFKCKVATEPLVPPELQGRNLNDPTACFSRETDQFALAVHIFLLLMKNYHPFNVRVLDTSVSSDQGNQAYNITVGNCPHLRTIPGCEVPLGAPNLKNMLPEKLVQDFAGTFDYSLNPSAPDFPQQLQKTIVKRTTAEAWYNDLHEFNQSADLVQCSQNPEHFYLRSSGKCELCSAQTQWVQHMNSISRSYISGASGSKTNTGGSASGSASGVKTNVGGSASGSASSVKTNVGGSASGSVSGVKTNVGGSASGSASGVKTNVGGSASGSASNVKTNVGGASTGTSSGGSTSGGTGGKKKSPFKVIAALICVIFVIAAIYEKQYGTPSLPSSKNNNVCIHSWTLATCTEPMRCTKCGTTTGSAAGHNWFSGTSGIVCLRCKEGQNVQYHAFVNETWSADLHKTDDYAFYSKVLSTPLKGVKTFRLHAKLDSGTASEEWRLYCMDGSGNWKFICRFNVKDKEEASLTVQVNMDVYQYAAFPVSNSGCTINVWGEDWYSAK